MITKFTDFLFRRNRNRQLDFVYVPKKSKDSKQLEKEIWAKLALFTNLRRLRMTIFRGDGPKSLSQFAE